MLDALRASPDHPTAAEAPSRVRDRHPGVGTATLYRTLDLLTALGLAHELTGEGGALRFDATTGRHDHLVCVSCGRVDDVLVDPPGLTGLNHSSGFEITGYDLTVRGVCPQCRAGAP